MSELSLRSILAATDLSEATDEVVRTAGALAALTGGALHLIHAFDFQDLPYTRDRRIEVSFQGRIQDAERALDEQIRRALPAGAPVASQSVVIRTTYKAVLERASDVSADLIVLGPHRRRPVADQLLGSTADRVIRTAEVPCLIVRGPISLPLRRILVPHDLSEHARAALEVALTWARLLGPGATSGAGGGAGAELDVLHVIPQILQMDATLDREVIGPELHREVRTALDRVEGASRLAVREELVWGDEPAAEIVRFAEQARPDLLVIGTHGTGAVRRALLGSVASAVARRATSPVLLVPPESATRS